jgi:uncharacterized protein (TIGR00296 family)|tara:strand:- start:25 stop:606 length:582 start_codon:yes stop_codon:yes gene_type:complete
MYSLDDGKILINLAKESIKTHFSEKEPNITEDIKQKYSDKRGVFVTLNKDGQLRGCIGFTEPIYILYEAILKAAKSAAFQDPRFPPVQQDEIDSLSIEISILTPPQLIKVRKSEDYLKEIKIGKDGLIIKTGLSSGLLLPQVASEYDWDVEKLLRHTCMKANLSYEAWKDLKHEIYKFQAQIFSEEDGVVVEK